MSPLSQYLEAVSLGALQGVAEFLPISSSGHLSLAQAVLDEATGRQIDPEGNRLLVIVLHVGTLGSILWSYRRDLWATATDVRYVTSVAVATAPLVVVALTPLKDRVEAMFAQPAVVGVCLLVTAGLLLAGQYLAVRRSDPADGEEASPSSREVTLPVAAVIGAFQTLALLPGISRSGSTIAGGLMSGLSREEAVRFSLMIGVPAIAGAGLLEAKSVLDAGVSLNALPIGPLAAGAGTAFLVGVAAISLLRKAVSNDRLHWFAAYCAAVGSATLVWQLT
ncbi:undecaprenyl-diphosphate phosphatase [Alienimonas californiensis]|uniref:undecaprenyl-diphosphate phosphatase n=1 Tax=Alienimonas californiensis TaxID=2527989 RepID=UPI0013FD0137|nr:undecaprenyl-diphosphate phosphatase [Alienimonas californiensis]